MSERIDVAEVLSASARRAASAPVMTLAAIGALLGVTLTIVLHVGGLAPEHGAAAGGSNLFITLVVLVATMVPTAWTEGAISKFVSEQEAGHLVPLGSAARHGLARMPTVYLAQVLMLGVVTLASMLCFVPGVIVYAYLAVVPAVAALEDVGVRNALARSRALSEGRTWRVFGVVGLAALVGFVALALMWCVLVAVPIETAPSAGRVMLAAMRRANDLNDPLAIALVAGVRSMVSAWWNSVITVLYVRLRRRERGADAEQIAEVFA